MKGTCTSCNIHSTYDDIASSRKFYPLTKETTYMMVTNGIVQDLFYAPIRELRALGKQLACKF